METVWAKKKDVVYFRMSLLFLLHMNIPSTNFILFFFPSSPLPVLSTQLRTRYEGMDVEGGGKRYQGKEEEKKNKYLREREREEGDDYVPPVSRPVYTSYKKITTTTWGPMKKK